VTTRQALARFERDLEPYAGSDDPMSAGNGSLMRLAPVAVRHWRDRETLAAIAARQSRTTHAAPEAIAGCVAYAEILADAISGRPGCSASPGTTDCWPRRTASSVRAMPHEQASHGKAAGCGERFGERLPLASALWLSGSAPAPQPR